MTDEAVVIPADPTKPVHVVTHETFSELITLLRNTTGGDRIASTRQLPSAFGPFRLWAGSDGFNRPVARNDRAIRLCQVARHTSGQDLVDLAGTTVVTGDLTGSSAVAAVPALLRNLLLTAFASTAQSTPASAATTPPTPTSTPGRRPPGHAAPTC